MSPRDRASTCTNTCYHTQLFNARAEHKALYLHGKCFPTELPPAQLSSWFSLFYPSIPTRWSKPSAFLPLFLLTHAVSYRSFYLCVWDLPPSHGDVRHATYESVSIIYQPFMMDNSVVPTRSALTQTPISHRISCRCVSTNER